MRGLPGSVEMPPSPSILTPPVTDSEGWMALRKMRCVYIRYSFRICQTDVCGLPEPEAVSR